MISTGTTTNMELLLFYIFGVVLSFGLYGGFVHRTEEKKIEEEPPAYESMHDDKLAYIFGMLSWIGILITAVLFIAYGSTPAIKFSYKSLWNTYNSKSEE